MVQQQEKQKQKDYSECQWADINLQNIQNF